jgi:hypothetical protein
MKLRLYTPLLASLLCALAGAAGCLNPRPEDFPSRTELDDDGDTASVGGGSNAGTPAAPTYGPDDNSEIPNAEDPQRPGDIDPPDEPDPEPGFGSDAGVPPEVDAGRDGGCIEDAD